MSKIYPLRFGKYNQPMSVQNVKFDISKYQNIINKRRNNKTIAESYKENVGSKSIERIMLPINNVQSRLDTNQTFDFSSIIRKTYF